MRPNNFVSACAVVASMTSLLIGYNVGATNDATIYIKELKTSQEPMKVVTAILNFLSFSGMVMAGRTSDRIGRRYAILLAGAIFFFGRLVLGFARNHAVLLVGRLVANVGVGYALMITPIYISEISPAFSRGKLSSFPEVFFNVGTFLGHVINYASRKVELNLGWPVMLCLAAISSYLLAIVIIAMPESPRWLVMQGHPDNAMHVLNMISDSKEEATLRFADINRAVENEVTQQGPRESVWRDLLLHPTRCVRHMLICVVAMHLFSQACGIDTILDNPHIFEKAGISNSNRKVLATIVVDFIKIVCMLYPTFYLDRAGRRPLILLSIGGMFFVLLFLGHCLTSIEQGNTEITWAVVILVLIYVVFFSVGLGPITSMYGSEVFPLRLRAEGSAIGFAMNQAASEVSSKIFLWLCKTITFGGAALLFATIALVLWILFYTMMPETMGRKLEEIGLLFGKYIEWRSAVREMEPQRINRVNRDATMSRPPSGALPRPSDHDVDG